MDLASHWNNTYCKNPIDKLGWYEDNPTPSLQLIDKCGLDIDASILNIGAGTSTLVDELLNKGYQNIIVNDISSTALDKLKDRLGSQQDKIEWIVDDVTNPELLSKLEKVDLWHDRAVLHFFCDAESQKAYFDLLRQLVKKNGYVIIAAFNLEGAIKCTGLPIHRYNTEMLQKKLGNDFKLIESFDYIYTMPSGDTRVYVYTLFKRL